MIRSLPCTYVTSIEFRGSTTSSTAFDIKSISLPDSKESIDDGEFVPGVYRVNPYSVSRGNTDAGGSKVTTVNSRYYYGDLQTFVASSEGGFTLDLLSQARASCALPSTDSYGQLALQKAKSKVATADLELGETVGEFGQTVALLKDPLSSLRKFLMDDRSRNFRLLLALMRGDKRQVSRLSGRTGKASIDAMANTWVELRYGLRPLVMLVQDVIERVNRDRDRLFDPNKIRSARSTMIFTEKHMAPVGALCGYHRFSGTGWVEDEIKATASIQYLMSQELGFMDALGLTPRFLPEVAWQLSNCSFVVDWIFSIGPWLGTLRVNPNVVILGNTVGIKVKRNISLKHCTAKNTNYVLRNTTPIGFVVSDSLTEEHYNRRCHVDMSYLPHFTWGRVLDLFRLVDSLSLIWQRLPKRRRK
jgi:hypothetical protein